MFTYIRVFGSTATPHVLPWYVSDKVLAKEIAYQIVTKGVTKSLKDSKKSIWPTFTLRCGVYCLNDFKHAQVEVKHIHSLNLVEFREMKYDPIKVVYDFTTDIKVKEFVHEDDHFDYLFLVVEQFSQVQSLSSL